MVQGKRAVPMDSGSQPRRRSRRIGHCCHVWQVTKT
jgi:hypothetical protein